MDIVLQIDDNKISEIIQDNINGISKDQISEAIIEGIKQYLSGDKGKEIIDKLLFDHSYYGSGVTDFGKEVIAKTLDKEQINELQGYATNIIKNHAKDIIVEAIVKIILDNISNKIDLSAALFNNPAVMQSIISHMDNYIGGYRYDK